MTETGLSSSQAEAKLKEDGYNELPAGEDHSFLHIAFSVIKEPMFGLLLAAGAVYFVIGDLVESVVLSIFALLSVGITVVQEWRSEKVLDALRDMSSPRALVVRDGKPLRISGREVVRNDLMILAEGDRVPADARIISPDTLMVDESLLTGESVPVEKSETNSVFAGTLIVRGNARTVVTGTGAKTEIGKIGQTLSSIKTEPPRLQKETARIVRFFAFFSITLSVICVLIYGLWRDEWLQGILNGIALAMSLLPEEFPLVLTVFMTMGAWRISKARVLTRKTSAIETLGSATVLCTDKTGTLTENKMSIVFLKSQNAVWKDGDLNPAPEILDILKAGMMASNKDSHDPMDLAFIKHPLSGNGDFSSPPPELRYGLRPDLLLTTSVYKKESGYTIYAKGAPETIAQACKFPPHKVDELHNQVKELAAEGLRVLAVAKAHHDSKIFPESAAAFDYEFLGLAGFSDPLRDDVPAAIEQCRSAGIRVIMITGDYPATAQTIARQAGIDGNIAITGSNIEKMTDEELREKVGTINIFARIMPEQKLRIVNALKQRGDIVAMTGDGVNDAPSLKAAHIGIAMGGRGTDVAREASSIVLLDDHFSSMVNTIAMGRRIYDNLKKAMIYIFAIHVPIAGLAFLPLLFDMPAILTPLLIALIEMVVDPGCSIVLEAEQAERDIMQRPPRDPAADILSIPVMIWGFYQGALSTVVLGLLWSLSLQKEMPIDETRSLMFASLLIVNIVLILVNRTFNPSLSQAFGKRNPFLGWGTAWVILFFGALLYWPHSRKLFDFGPLHIHDIAYAAGASLLLLFLLEASKFLIRRKIFS